MKPTLFLALATAALTIGLGAQQPPTPAGEQVVVTALGHHGAAAPVIAENQVQVQAGHDHPAVTGWQSCAGAGAAARLDLAVVLDDDSSRIYGPRLADIKDFVHNLPPTTAVAIVYLRSGTIEITQPFTTDHAAAIAALRSPVGTPGISPSPFDSLQALLSKWPRYPGRRRELVVFSDAVDDVGGSGSNNSTFEGVVNRMAANGIVAYGIFVAGPTSLGMGADMGKTTDNNGNVNLSILADATGGEAYSMGDDNPPRFTPFLDDIAARLQSQYLLDFTANPERGHGLVGLKVAVKDADANITAPKQVYVAEK